PVAAEQRRQAEVNRRWHLVHDLVGGRHVSRRAGELLARRGLGPALLGADPAKAEAYDGIDTLKVLLVRISFATNREPGLTTIPPDGGFMLTPPVEPEPIPIDPPPHDKAYFASHMHGLSEYYRYQSGGRLHIEGRVLPDADQGSYQLTDVADYGPGRDGFWTIDSLERMVRDMITVADQGAAADGVALSDYDDDDPFTYIIFVHSGSDWQSDVLGDSPNDIPTFFISLGEPQPLTGGLLSECSIIPETTNQDGYPGSIAAAFYHEFGHALGLPDVYSTATGLPSVGIWDLMDSGTNLPVTLGTYDDQGELVTTVATGVLPPSLSAWNKWFLGWLEVKEITSRSTDSALPAVQVPRTAEQYGWHWETNRNFDLQHPQALRGGISPREWFLLENRWVPDDAAATPWDTLRFERDEDTGVILYLTGYRNGEWQNSGLYDYFLPAGGLLAWHVNMDRIEAGLADNTINAFGDGLRLVEADGIQDIGVLDSYVIGWYGSYLDPFSERTGQQDLFAEGFPNTRAFDRSWTGLSVTGVRNFGMNDAVLRFSARIDGVVPNFPWSADPVGETEAAAGGGEPGARALDVSSLTPLVVGGSPVLVFADAAPADWSGDPWPTGLNGLTNAGAPRWAAPAGRPASEFAQLTAPLAGPPVAWTEPDGSARLLCGTTDGQVTFFTLPAAGLPMVAWTVDVGDSLAHGPLLYGPSVSGSGAAVCMVPVAPDRLVTLDLADGSPLGDAATVAGGWSEARPRTQLAPDGPRFILFTTGGWHSLPTPGSAAVSVFDLDYDRALVGTPQTAVSPDLVAVFDDLGLVGAWDAAGARTSGPDPAAPLVAEPAVADLDGDSRHDVVLATAERIFACRPDGTALRGFPARLAELFPLPDSTRLAGPVVVADVDGDGVNEITIGTGSGHLLSLTATGELRQRFPLRWGDRAGSGFAVGEGENAAAGRALW
ncbi:MAG: immune inhibitor A, partial [Krumholzibacteria bacterium]|nr:immune inhibitor A [Candidatus Krumholzibacteria bacterium]